MPEMPGPLPDAVGMASPQGIYISKSDWAQLVARDVGIRAVISALVGCVVTRSHE